MGSGSRQYQGVAIDVPNEQPVGLEVTLPGAGPLLRQSVRAVVRIQCCHRDVYTSAKKGCTSTSAPGSTEPLSSGSRMKQFASLMVWSSPEPVLPVWCTTGVPSGSRDSTAR